MKIRFWTGSTIQLFLLIVELVLSNFIRLFSTTKPVSQYISNDCDLRTKIVIVTGSNTGIGKETAIQLCKRGATVILACRDVQRGMEASKDINKLLESIKGEIAESLPFALKGKAMFMRLDLSDLATVIEFAEKVRANFPQVDILVNNAGLNGDAKLPNGIERVFQVNYLGHYLLTRALLDMMTGKGCRVVNLSSVMHHLGQGDFRKSSRTSDGDHSIYCDTKLYMNLLTMQINKGVNLDGSSSDSDSKRQLLAVSANPGAVRSDIWRNFPFQSVFQAIMKALFLEVDEGAATSVYGATVDSNTVTSIMRKSIKNRSSKGGHMISHPLLPYLVPYRMPFSWLGFETLGRFAGPVWSRVTLPTAPVDTVEQLAQELWDYSGDLCIELLQKAGAEAKSYAFLQKK